MLAPTNMSAPAIAVNRFGLGARPDEIAPNDPKKWLLDQFAQYQITPTAWANQAKTVDLITEYVAKAKQLKQIKQTDEMQQKDMRKSFVREIRDDYQAAVQMRAESALLTPAPFIERLVHFWANHFAVSVEKRGIAELAGAFELEAIRPNVLGSFKNMLLAVAHHPAMLMYLDQTRSIGPNSQADLRSAERNADKKRGLNENLGREILELHTLGVRSGYSQSDVTEFARALTGWSITGEGGGNKRNQAQFEEVGKNGFAFRSNLHEPGSRNLLGKTYAQTGSAQAEAILSDLASAQTTATHIATKLARHFVGDTPPANLVDKLANTFTSSNGDLPSIYKVLIDAPEAWQAAPAKFKTPWEWLISCERGLGLQSQDKYKVAQILNQLGQPIWKPGSPAGFDDIAETWAAPNALLRRIELVQRLVAPYGDKLDARTLGDKLLLGSLSPQTKTAISRAESASTGLALLFVSPEFLRR